MTKKELTRLILKESNLDISLDKAYKLWWYKDLNDTNFRLTIPGYKQFKELSPSYTFKVEFWSTPKTFKQLKKINSPYYIESKYKITEIVIFSAKLATAIKLYKDFDHFINSL